MEVGSFFFSQYLPKKLDNTELSRQENKVYPFKN